MARGKAVAIVLSEAERSELEGLEQNVGRHVAISLVRPWRVGFQR